METKIGVYICRGCDIAKAVDIEKLVAEATKGGKAAVCKAHDILCAAETVESIRQDIKTENLNRVAIAACSGRVFTELFDFGKEVLTDRISLREQVAWSHAPNDEDTQMLAEDYIRMGIARLQNSEPPEPYIEPTSKSIMVIGGGMSGLQAALAIAEAGYQAILIEKEKELGGWAAKTKKSYPDIPPYTDLDDTGLQELIQKVKANKNIKIHTATVVEKTSGQPGKFAVTLKHESGIEEIEVGAIILAAGWRPYDAGRLTHLGYGISPDVVTNVDIERMMGNGGIKRPSDGKKPASVVFIQCAGSRDENHLPYCSAVCCLVSLKQAMYIRQSDPEAKIYVIYKDMRTPAQHELFYARVQDDDAIFFTKGEIREVTKDNTGKLQVTAVDTLLGDNITIKADLVVLATGMVPATKVEIAETEAEGEASTEQAATTADGKKEAAGAEKGARIINLTYRQGTDLPTLKYGFPDSHYICFPYETRRTAIYACGAVRAPMGFADSRDDAYGAALKAIQAVEAVSRGLAVHPRSGDPSFPEFFMQRCTQCKRCTEECPFGTLDEDEKGTPLPNPFRCRRCGVCMGACPERIISFKNYNVNMMSQMIKSIHIPDEFEEKPRILAFICENDALPSVDMAGLMRLRYNAMIRIIPLRCLGSMNTVWVSDALASGFDGVMLIGCKKGDDYQCHFIRGSELAATRMTNVREKLKQLVLEEERVRLHELAISDYRKIPAIFDGFLEEINKIGPNPYKGM